MVSSHIVSQQMEDEYERDLPGKIPILTRGNPPETRQNTT